MTAYCAVPDTITSVSRDPTPAVFTLNAPAASGEVCDTSVTTTTTTGGSTPISTTTTVAGPPGPVGPPGATPTLPEHDGMRWAGVWESGKSYFKSTPANHVHADTVRTLDKAVYVCIQDHISDSTNQPQLSTFVGPSPWPSYWALVIEDTAPDSGLPPEQQTFIDGLIDGVFDWMNSATIGDWLAAIAIGAGVVWAGSAIVDSFTDNGSDATADSRYNGSPSFSGTFIAPSIRDVAESLCEEAGITNFDVSLLPDDVECHFSLAQVTSVRTILDNMAKTFQFDMVDSGGILKFIPRNSTIVRTLTHDDMGFNSSRDVIAPVTMKRLQSVDLPRSVTLTYMSEDLDYNNYSQKSEIATFAAGNDVSLTVPFMLTHAFAKQSTDKILIGAHLERMQYTFKTSYQNAIDLEPGDVISIPEGYVRIIQIEETDEGILEISAVDAGAVGAPQPIIVSGVTIGYTASTYVGTGLEPQLPSAVINAAAEISKSGALFFDPPVLDSSDIEPRVYAAIHGYGVQGWPGAQIFRSVDNGLSYSLIGQQTTSALWGLVGTPITGTQAYYWDTTTVITVQMKTGTLLSKSEAAVLAGENLCMVGEECIGFCNATLISGNVYQLSKLLRGRRGTEYAMTTHVANELFVLLDSTIFEIPVPVSDRGKTFKYKVVTIGSDLSKVDPIDVQVFGNNTIPWTASSLGGTKVGNDWNLTWVTRPRFNNGILDYQEIPNDADYGGFALLIYSGTTVVRQQIVYGNTFTYTLAMQTADFGGPESSLKFGIVQISNRFGGGRQTIVNI